MALELNITDPALIGEAIALTGASLLDEMRLIPGLQSDAAWNLVVEAGKIAYAESYKYVYYVSIAFGTVSIIAACFLGDIEKYMDDHVAVIIN
jgi:Fungal trichothecene efflux pump (TRI12)